MSEHTALQSGPGVVAPNQLTRGVIAVASGLLPLGASVFNYYITRRTLENVASDDARLRLHDWSRSKMGFLLATGLSIPVQAFLAHERALLVDINLLKRAGVLIPRVVLDYLADPERRERARRTVRASGPPFKGVDEFLLLCAVLCVLFYALTIRNTVKVMLWNRRAAREKSVAGGDVERSGVEKASAIGTLS